MLKTLSRACIVLLALTAGASAQSEIDESCTWYCQNPLADAQAAQDAENAVWVTEEEAQAIAEDAADEADETLDDILHVDLSDLHRRCPVGAIC